MKKAIDIADLIVKCLSSLAIIVGGYWAYYQFDLGGAKGWEDNMSIQTQVMPYHDNLRLLVVHVKSKNPRNVKFELNKPDGSFELLVHKIPDELKSGAVTLEDEGEVLAKVNLLPEDGYEFLPNAEYDDMATIVLPVGITVSLTANMGIVNGTLTKDRKPDFDFVSASTVVRVEP